MTAPPTFALLVTIDGDRRAYCPSGGVSAEEALRTEALVRRATDKPANVERVPYVFDVLDMIEASPC